jgi:anti-sigma factor RsiW
VTGRIVSLEPDEHVAVQSLLPWYVTGRLDAAEAAQVDAHLPHCEACRAELAAERQWQRLQPAAVAQVDVEAGWSAMLERLGHTEDEHEAVRERARGIDPARGARGRLRAPRGWTSAGPLLRWGWTAPSLLAAGLLVAFGLQPGMTDDVRRGTATGTVTATAGPDAAAPAYRALAAPASPTAAALVRFRAGATEAEVRAALRRCEARVVDGPTATDAWVVALPRDHYAQALAALRAQPAVTLAEALEAEGSR